MENRRGENQGVWVRASKGRGSQGLAQHGAGRQHAHTRACTLLSPVCVFFPLQMLFDKSNYANFLPCGLKSVFDLEESLCLFQTGKTPAQLSTHRELATVQKAEEAAGVFGY